MTLPVTIGALAIALTLSSLPARAQMGSVNNPPPQHLFDMGQPKRLDDGLGTMAERRQRLAQMRAHRSARAPVPLPAR